MKRSLAVLSALALSSSVFADNNMMVRMRGVQVTPDESGSPTIHGHVRLDNTSVPEMDFSYFISEHFAMELILATTTHRADAVGTALNNVALGSVTLLPPTLTAQYHQEMGKFKPYVGAGLNYTFFYDVNPGGGAVKNITYSNAMGYALQVGTDFKIAENVYLNFDIKKIYLATNVNIETYSNGNTSAKVHIDPLLIGFGIGYRF